MWECFGLASPKVVWVWKDTSKQLKLKAILHFEDNSEFYMFLGILKIITIETTSYEILCGIYIDVMWELIDVSSVFSAAH